MSKPSNFYLQSTDTSTSSLSRPSQSHPHSRTTSQSKIPTTTSTQQLPKSSQNSNNNTTTTSSNHYHTTNNYDYNYNNDTDSDDDTSLPFPAPLPRSDFLSPTFDPSTYLSNLAATRYQTLEDLRVELRTRSQHLNQELLELVNAHHEDFIDLGRSLKGGEEKIEEVRVGVMGFKREVEDVRRQVLDRETQVDALLAERQRIRRDIELGRQCIDLDERIRLLERRLGVAAKNVDGTRQDNSNTGEDASQASDEDDFEDDDEDDDYEEEDDDEAVPENDQQDTHITAVNTAAITKIKRRTQDLIGIQHLADRLGRQLPFVEAQQDRLAALHKTLLLDLGAVLTQLRNGPQTASTADRKLQVLALYREIGASKEAVGILQGAG